jgi:two-component system NtrC family sensor kinase
MIDGQTIFTGSYRFRLWLLTLFIVALILAAGYLLTRYLADQAWRDVIRQGDASISILASNVKSATGRIEKGALTLSGSPGVSAALITHDAGDIRSAEEVLDRYNKALEADVCYLLDRTGLVIASSNRNDADSFVGKNYKFRPYFIEAIKGEKGRYFASGITSLKRGFYASSPVRDVRGRIIGVTVVKENIDDIENYLRNYEYSFLISPEGVIFLSGRPDIVLKSLWPLGKDVEQRVLFSRQFGDKPFEAFLPREVANGTDIRLQGKRFLVFRKIIDPQGWSIVLISSLERVTFYKFIGVAATLIVLILASSLILIIRETNKARTVHLESEQKLQSILHGSFIPTFVIGKDHKILYWNKALEEISRIGAADIIGTTEQWKAFYERQRPTLADLLVDGTIEAIPDWYSDKVIKSALIDEAYEAVDFFPALGDSGKWLRFTAAAVRDSSGRLIGAIETLEDITDLRRAEELFRTIADTSRAGVYIVQDGRFQFINYNAAGYAGYSVEEMTGMKSLNIVYPEDVETAKINASEMLKGKRAAPYEFRIIRKDGRVRWIMETVTSIDYHGVKAVLGNSMDITEQKQSEESLKKAFQDLREAKDMLVQSEKLAAMGRLSSGVAHEIRNPLNIMSLNLQMLEIKGVMDDDTKKAVSICHSQIGRIVKIVEGLRMFSRMSEKKLSPENIQEVVDHVFSLSGPRLRIEDVAVSVKCNPGLPRIFMDRAAMEQVFFNLISNALDAMKDREKKVLTIAAERKEGNILVTVSDTGHGLREEDLPKLFDPFFTTKGPDKGTGLGLSISYGIIQDHKGKIRAENNEAGGATFYIELPIEKRAKS